MNGPIAVTGASGFVGSHVVAALLRRGKKVRVLLRSTSVLPQNLQNESGLERVSGALSDRHAISRLVSGARGIIHCAGVIAAARRDDFFTINAAGSVVVAEAAKAADVGRFIHVSSLAARAPELSAYAASKRRGEERVLEILGENRACVVRPPAVYGPGDRATLPLLAQLLNRNVIIPGTPNQRLSLIYVKDLADAIVNLALTERPPVGVMEIDDGKENGYGWAEIAGLAGEMLGHKPHIWFAPRFIVHGLGAMIQMAARISGKQPMLSMEKVAELYYHDWLVRQGDNAKITGWQPITGFCDGFRQTMCWYEREGWLRIAPAVIKTLG